MALILFKWLFVAIISSSQVSPHPIYISVTEIDHNAKDQTLEISCKLFTDDFEKTLRKQHNKKIDLLDSKYKQEMNTVVNNYIQQHLKIALEGKLQKLSYLGFEEQEEGIISYFQINNVPRVKELVVNNNLLYEYVSQQISLLHVTVNGNRKSTKLNNPEEKAVFSF